LSQTVVFTFSSIYLSLTVIFLECCSATFKKYDMSLFLRKEMLKSIYNDYPLIVVRLICANSAHLITQYQINQ